MMRIGAHMSVAGGVSRAVERARLHGCEALQIFTKNASRWQAPPLDPAEVRRFRDAVDEAGIAPVVSHASYLINLATSRPALRAQSLAALLDELDRAESLGLTGVVIHPGTCTEGTEADALRLAAATIREAFDARPRHRARLLLELTAGRGRTIGYDFDHLAAILAHLDGSPRVGICLDTCHLMASGHDVVSPEGYVATFARFERIVGFDRLAVVHANDSKRPCGSRVDRHEHIGDGCLGVEPFRRLLHDSRCAGLPLLIETEKAAGRRGGPVVLDPYDLRNLETLRHLRAGHAETAVR